MRRAHFSWHPGRVPTRLRVAGLALVLLAGLATIVGALPVGGFAFYAAFTNLNIGGTPVPNVVHLRQNLPLGGCIIGPITPCSTFPTSWHPSTGNVNLPTLLNSGEFIASLASGDPDANTILMRAHGPDPIVILPFPSSSPSATTGFFRAANFTLEGALGPGGFRTAATFPAAGSDWFPTVIDPRLFAQAPPNVRLEIEGLGTVYLHETQEVQSGNQTVVRANGLRFDFNLTTVPAAQIPVPITGELVLGHVEMTAERPIVAGVSAGSGAPGTSITVTGTGFRPGETSVDIGGVPATDIEVTSETELTITVPELLGGTWPVNVMTPVDRFSLPNAFTSDNPTSGLPVAGHAFALMSTIAPVSTPANPLPFAGAVVYGPWPAVELPEGGGSESDSLGLLPAIPGANRVPGGLLTAEDLEATTDGGPANPELESVASSGPFNIGNGLLQAEGGLVRCERGVNGPVCITSFVNLRSSVLGALPATPEPNTSITIPGLGSVVLNAYSNVVEDGMRLAIATGISVNVNIPGIATGDLLFLRAAIAVQSSDVSGPLSPATGPETGGTVVTIPGTGFVEPVQVLFGGVPALTVTVDSPTQIRATTPPHAPGAVDVVVTSPSGSETLQDAFTYTAAPAPTATSIVPTSGPVGGGILATITGTGFMPGATVTFGDTPSPQVTVLNATTLQARVPPASLPGFVNVVVTTPRGSSSPFGLSFTYSTAPVTSPAITGVSPPSGDAGTVVTVAGTGFLPGARVTICSQLVTPSSVTGTAVAFAAPSCSIGGPQDVTVTNPNGGSDTLPASFTYPGTGVSLPSISSVSPSTGPVTGGTLVTISGANFLVGTTVSFGGAPSPAVDLLNPTTVQVQVPAAPGGAEGAVDVVVTTPVGSVTLIAGFTYTSEPPAPAPAITAITPAEGEGGTSVTITGTGFQPGATVMICRRMVTPISVSATQIVFTAPSCPAGGPQDVRVTNPDGGFATQPGGFTYPLAAPTIETIAPQAGPVTGEITVTITGTGFAPGAEVNFGGADSPAVNVLSSTTLQVQVPPAPGGDTGPVDVVVTTSGGSATLPDGFNYIAGGITPPSITDVSPSTGLAGTPVTVTGDGFQPGVTVTICAQVVTPVTASTTSLTFNAPGCPQGGPQAVTVLNPDGGSATMPEAFTYGVVGPPTIVSVTPPSGPVDGGTTVTVTGTNFNGTSVTFGGVEGTNLRVISSTTLVVDTPPAPGGAPGSVDVVVTTENGVATFAAGFTYFGPSVTPPEITSVEPASGNAGLDVTVTGAGFQANATVTICGQIVATVFTTATQLVFSTPSCLVGGPQDVTVVNPDFGSDTLPAGFTYGTLPPPTISSISPTFGPPEGGTVITITGASFVPGMTATFGNAPPSQVTIFNSTTVQVTTPPAPAPPPLVVNVTVTTPGGDATLPNGFTYSGPGTPVDSDGDGMSDDDEKNFGLDPTDPTDATDDPDGDGIPNIDEVNGNPQSHPRGFFVQYLAEGATGFFNTQVGIFNPNGSVPERVLVTLFPEPPHEAVSLPFTLDPMGRRTVDVGASLPNLPPQGAGVSIRVESDEPISTMRQMLWDDPTRPYGGTLESGSPEPSPTWYFGEGATYVFDLYYLIVNPNRTPANVTIRYLRQAGEPITQQIQVPASSRSTIYANRVPGLEFAEVSAVMESDQPIVAERAMYLSLNGRPLDAGQAGVGVTTPAMEWFLAEGATNFFDTFVSIANPNDQEAHLLITYQLPDGTTIPKQHRVPAQSRRTVLVESEDPRLVDTAVAIRVRSSNVPVIVERAMWWGPTAASWYESHSALGSTEAGTLWAVAEGASGGPAAEDTFILVSNTSPELAWVRFTICYDGDGGSGGGGGGAGGCEEMIIDSTGNSRMTHLVRELFPDSEGRRFSVLVESKALDMSTPPAPITVEVSRYQSPNGLFAEAGGAALATKIR